MGITVQITKGEYRGKPVVGTFTLVKNYQEGAKGGFITIRNPEPAFGKPSVQRVGVEKGNFTVLGDDGEALPEGHDVGVSSSGAVEVTTNYEHIFTSSETEDEAMTRIADTFLMLDKITDAVARGVVRGLVVSGPPGVGKSFGVEKQLEAANMFRTIGGQDPNYEVVTGGVSAIGLYQKLYHNSKSEHVLCFDDSDALLFDEECLSLLKGALNSGDKRRIAWNKESRVLLTEGIPESFNFEGGIIFISNIDFEASIARGSRISAHLEAIMSRCHYLDLEISSMRDKLLRIKQVLRDGMLDGYGFSEEQTEMVMSFIVDNQEHLREVSLRAVKKIADFVKAEPKGWYEMAEATMLLSESKFKRLLEKKKEEEKKGVILNLV